MLETANFKQSEYELSFPEGFPRLTCKKTGIWTEVVQMSRSAVNGQHIITYRRHYNRFIHPEVLKHRMWSVSSESSRARPTMSMVLNILKYPAKFPEIGVNCKGMQSKEIASKLVETVFNLLDNGRKFLNLGLAWFYIKVLKLHKQVANRHLERDAMINDVTTGTDLDHFLNLRIANEADPVIQVIAEQMYALKEYCRGQGLYEVLQSGEWHVPFVTRKRNPEGVMFYVDGRGKELTIAQAKELSAVSCAQTSYRKNDDVYDPTHRVWEQLIMSKPVHATPVEHQATPMDADEVAFRFNTFTFMLDNIACQPPELENVLYSGNFKYWRQHRKEIEGEKFLQRFKTDRTIVLNKAA